MAKLFGGTHAMGLARRILSAACGLAALGLAGCVHGPVSESALDYNRAIAAARSEELLLNIVRASARAPLQFTSLAEVDGTLSASAGLGTTISNIFGAPHPVTPNLSLSGSDTAFMRINPLSSSDFTKGVLQPIPPEVLHLFLAQGWDPKFLLPLVVARFECGGRVVDNSGLESGADARARLARAASDFRLDPPPVPPEPVTMTVSTDQAIALIKQADGGKRGVKVAEGPAPDRKTVTLTSGKPEWVVHAPGLCEGGREPDLRHSGESTLQLRSVEGIVYALGEALRDCYRDRSRACTLGNGGQGENERYLLRVTTGDAGNAAVSVRFEGRRYSVARSDRDERDRTLKTIEFLNELIALQTNGASGLTPTVLALPAG
jgi:hypothetical protein